MYCSMPALFTWKILKHFLTSLNKERSNFLPSCLNFTGKERSCFCSLRSPMECVRLAKFGVAATGFGLSLVTWEPNSCWFRDGKVLEKFQHGLKRIRCPSRKSIPLNLLASCPFMRSVWVPISTDASYVIWTHPLTL